jgi:4,5-dihydroxyphthalate decarboxylase
MGPDPFAYGLEANCAQLETFLGHMLEQGLIAQPLTPDELFAPQTRAGGGPSAA